MQKFKTLRTVPRALLQLLRSAIEDERQRGLLAGVRYGRDVIVRGADRIKTGRNVFVDHRAYINCNSNNEGRGYITMGDNVELGPYSIIWGGGGVEIGNNVHIGAHVHITSMEGVQVAPTHTAADHGIDVECHPVKIGDHVLICSGSVVVPGVTIGHHAMVAAGAVVVDDVPPYALVAGVPARIVRRSKFEEPIAAGGGALRADRGSLDFRIQ